MAAAHADPPAVARQRVRRALRKAREATPWSQAEVARQLGWSLSKMQRIEGGEVAISPIDLRAVLEVYGVTDTGLIERLMADARASRRQRYVLPQEHRDHLSAGLRELMQFEREASAIRAYQPVFYPGVLQTPAVAAAILSFWHAGLSEDERRVRFDVRMERRRQLLERSDGPEYHLLLDESVIKRRIENIKTTAEQLEVVAEVARLPHAHIRILPFSKSSYMPAVGSFQILDLAGDGAADILYRESYLRDEVVHDAAEIRIHRALFEDLWKESLSEGATLRAIEAESAQLRSLLDYE